MSSHLRTIFDTAISTFRRKRCYRISASFSSQSSNTPPQSPPNAAVIIQGPSLLVNTSAYRPSPSLFLLPGLRSLPFWTAPPNSSRKVSIAYNDSTITSIVKHLEANYEAIKEEYMSAVIGMSTRNDMSVASPSVKRPLEPDYDVNVKGSEHMSDKLHSGTWDWHSYVLKGNVQAKFKQFCPMTVSILQEIQDSLFFDTTEHDNTINPFGFCFFSTLGGKSYIQPHTGPMNVRLRLHLPLVVPSDTKPDAYSNKPHTKCGVRVGDQIRSWEEGKVVVLDDSYEHEAWNETNEMRVVLLIDVWHPDVRKEERKRIGNMFQFAVEQGWMNGGAEVAK